jgi:hypothetical protein
MAGIRRRTGVTGVAPVEETLPVVTMNEIVPAAESVAADRAEAMAGGINA